ncbi:MAG: sigma 54-interacting transcriptional regulator [Planctomycetes bacterium]|nr:sigma 54-interacting transcriptional regulator [Planctomycetota bacterium]
MQGSGHGVHRRRGSGTQRPCAKLIICENGKNRTLDLSSRVTTIGRSQENVIEIDDINSSRRHCQIERHDGNYEIVDLKSRNGTLVNGILVLRKELRPGDCIEVGKTRMFFEHVSEEYSEETIDLTTDRFLEPLSELDEEDRLEALHKEREIFLKLLEINRNMNSKIVLGDLLDLLVDTVVEVTGAERGFLLLLAGADLEIKAARNADREAVRDPGVKFSHRLASMVVKSGRPFRTDDVGQEPLAKEKDEIESLGLKSVLCVPIRSEGVALGAIYVENRFDTGAFTSNHLRWLEIVADQAAVSIRNAQLFEENRKRQKELEEAQGALEKLNSELEEKVLSKSLQLEEVIRLLPHERPAGFKYDYGSIVTRSPKMFEIFRLLDKVTDSSVPVLVLGESGTGKELIARAIHENGPRRAGAFVSENCAAIPINLMESEFFGHVRGAFTGATRDKRGLFEVADNGTLFLDEIADMPASMQTKLLRVLQEGDIRRVGGKEVIRVNVRIISATNKNIYDMVRQSQFREDLLYRINVITITLPPLRDRREDIPLLIDFFLQCIAGRTGEPKKVLDRETFHLLYQYDWPGNVRELENEIERLAALSGERIDASLLSPNIQTKGAKRGYSFEGQSLKDVVARTVEDVEMQILRSTLADTRWKKSKAAELLGISRPTLDAKIEKYKLSKETDRPSDER